MDKQTQRQLLEAEYYSYLELLSQRGITVLSLDEDTLKLFNLGDLRQLVERLKTMARTPK